MRVTGNQIRAGRSLLGVDQAWLAEKAGIAINTVRKIEAHGSDPVTSSAVTVDKVEGALQAAGVVLIAPGKHSPSAGGGVRLTEMPWDAVPEANMFGIVQRAILKKQRRLLELLRSGSVESLEVQELIAEIEAHLRSAVARQDLEGS